ncbi:MAG: hypothetical protein LBS19_01070 [Clostridiales bacterium]|jgi:hypothetical protein|nr:hypothetical protein [Clostridiales bacterium]
MNYLLIINNHPPIIVHDEDKAQYYAALEHYDRTDETAPMCEFLTAQTILTWSKTLERERKRNLKTF